MPSTRWLTAVSTLRPQYTLHTKPNPNPDPDPNPNPNPNQYTLHTKLGDGMTATVFVAFDKLSKKTCACKLAERKARQPNWPRLVKVPASLTRTPASPELASPRRRWSLLPLAVKQ